MGYIQPGPTKGQKIAGALQAGFSGISNIGNIMSQYMKYQEDLKTKEQDLEFKKATMDVYKESQAEKGIQFHLDKARSREATVKGAGVEYLKLSNVVSDITKRASVKGRTFDEAIYQWNQPLIQLQLKKEQLGSKINTFAGMVNKSPYKPAWVDDKVNDFATRLAGAGLDATLISGIEDEMDQTSKDFVTYYKQQSGIRERGAVGEGRQKTLGERFRESMATSLGKQAAGEDPDAQTRERLRQSGMPEERILQLVPRVKITPEAATLKVRNIESTAKRLDIIESKIKELKASGFTDVNIGQELIKMGATQDEIKAVVDSLQ